MKGSVCIHSSFIHSFFFCCFCTQKRILRLFSLFLFGASMDPSFGVAVLENERDAMAYTGFVAEFGTLNQQRTSMTSTVAPALPDAAARALDRCFSAAKGNASTTLDEDHFLRFLFYAELCTHREVIHPLPRSYGATRGNSLVVDELPSLPATGVLPVRNRIIALSTPTALGPAPASTLPRPAVLPTSGSRPPRSRSGTESQGAALKPVDAPSLGASMAADASPLAPRPPSSSMAASPASGSNSFLPSGSLLMASSLPTFVPPVIWQRSHHALLLAHCARAIFSFLSQNSGQLRRDCFFLALAHCMYVLCHRTPACASVSGLVAQASTALLGHLLQQSLVTHLSAFLRARASTYPFPERHFASCAAPARVLFRFSRALARLYDAYCERLSVSDVASAVSAMGLAGDAGGGPDHADSASPDIADDDSAASVFLSDAAEDFLTASGVTVEVRLVAPKPAVSATGFGRRIPAAAKSVPVKKRKWRLMRWRDVERLLGDAGLLESLPVATAERVFVTTVAASVAKHGDCSNLGEGPGADGAFGSEKADCLPYLVLTRDGFFEFTTRIACEALADDAYATFLTLEAKLHHFIVCVFGPLFHSLFNADIATTLSSGGTAGPADAAVVNLGTPVITSVEPSVLTTMGALVTLRGEHLGALGRGVYVYCSVATPPVVYVDAARLGEARVAMARKERDQERRAIAAEAAADAAAALASNNIQPEAATSHAEGRVYGRRLAKRAPKQTPPPSTAAPGPLAVAEPADPSSAASWSEVQFVLNPVTAPEVEWLMAEIRLRVEATQDTKPAATSLAATSLAEGSPREQGGRPAGLRVELSFSTPVYFAVANAPEDLTFSAKAVEAAEMRLLGSVGSSAPPPDRDVVFDDSRGGIVNGALIRHDVPSFRVSPNTVRRMEDAFMEACQRTSVFNYSRLYRAGFRYLCSRCFGVAWGGAGSASSGVNAGRLIAAATVQRKASDPPPPPDAVKNDVTRAQSSRLCVLGPFHWKALGILPWTSPYLQNHRRPAVTDDMDAVDAADGRGGATTTQECVHAALDHLFSTHARCEPGDPSGVPSMTFEALLIVVTKLAVTHGCDRAGTVDSDENDAEESRVSSNSAGVFRGIGSWIRFWFRGGSTTIEAARPTSSCGSTTSVGDSALQRSPTSARTTSTDHVPLKAGEELVRALVQQRRAAESLRCTIAAQREKLDLRDRCVSSLEDTLALHVASAGKLLSVSETAVVHAMHFVVDSSARQMLASYQRTLAEGWQHLKEGMPMAQLAAGSELSGSAKMLPSKEPGGGGGGAIPPSLSQRVIASVTRCVVDVEATKRQLREVAAEAEASLDAVMRRRDGESRRADSLDGGKQQAEIVAELQSLTIENRRLSQKLQSSLAERDNARGTLISLQDDIEQKMRDSKEQLDLLETANSGYRSQLAKAKADLKQQQQQLAEKASKDRALKQRDDALKQQMETLAARRDKASSAAAVAKAERGDSSSSGPAIQEQLHVAQQHAIVSNARVLDLEIVNTKIKAKADQLSIDLLATKEQLAASQEQNKRLDRQLQEEQKKSLEALVQQWTSGSSRRSPSEDAHSQLAAASTLDSRRPSVAWSHRSSTFVTQSAVAQTKTALLLNAARQCQGLKSIVEQLRGILEVSSKPLADDLRRATAATLELTRGQRETDFNTNIVDHHRPRAPPDEAASSSQRRPSTIAMTTKPSNNHQGSVADNSLLAAPVPPPQARGGPSPATPRGARRGRVVSIDAATDRFPSGTAPSAFDAPSTNPHRIDEAFLPIPERPGDAPLHIPERPDASVQPHAQLPQSSGAVVEPPAPTLIPNSDPIISNVVGQKVSQSVPSDRGAEDEGETSPRGLECRAVSDVVGEQTDLRPPMQPCTTGATPRQGGGTVPVDDGAPSTDGAGHDNTAADVFGPSAVTSNADEPHLATSPKFGGEVQNRSRVTPTMGCDRGHSAPEAGLPSPHHERKPSAKTERRKSATSLRGVPAPLPCVLPVDHREAASARSHREQPLQLRSSRVEKSPVQGIMQALVESVTMPKRRRLDEYPRAVGQRPSRADGTAIPKPSRLKGWGAEDTP